MKTDYRLRSRGGLWAPALALTATLGGLLLLSAPVAVAQQNLTDVPPVVGPPEPPGQNGSGTVEGGACTIYLDRGSFDAAFPGLPIEDFEAGLVSPGAVIGCPAPINSTTSNACITPGNILSGVSFRDEPLNAAGGGSADGIAMVGAGAFGAPSINIVANTFVDAFVIEFSPAVGGAGMDLVAYFSSPQTVNIDVYGASGLLVSTSASASNGGSFWGVGNCGEGITQIDILSTLSAGDGAEGVDNVAFGAGGVPTTGPLALVLLLVLLAAGSVTILFRR